MAEHVEVVEADQDRASQRIGFGPHPHLIVGAARLGVDRLIVYVEPPYDEGVARLGEIVSRWERKVSRCE